MPNELFDIKKFFRRFSPIETCLWLNVVASHPNNQHYQSRFRFLIGLLLSIPENEFQHRKPNHEVFHFFFKKISEQFSDIFLSVEDFQGFSQNSLIPIFHKGNKYHCFYGDLERPIELYMAFFDLYFFDKEPIDDDLSILRNTLIDSLNFQTALLSKISTLEESNIELDDVYVPTDFYCNEISNFFLCERYPDPNNLLLLGDFSDMEEQDILNQEGESRLFARTAIDDKRQKKQYYLMPQSHMEAFFLQGKNILQSSNEIKGQVYVAFKQRLVLLLNQFFRGPNQIHAIFLELSSINILNDRIDYAVLIDSNKLFLFSAVEHSLNVDISDNLAISIDRLNQAAETIINNDIIGILQPDSKTFIGYPGRQIEVFICPIFEPINFNYLTRSNKKHFSNLFLFSFMDLKAVLSKIGSPFDFLKFLREEANLKAKIHHPLLGEFIERFTYYIENGNAYFESGQEMHAIFFEPHAWHFKIMPELHEKFQDETYEIIERKFPGFFNEIEKIEPNIYTMMNTSYLEGAYLVRWKDQNIWILGQPGGLSMNFIEAQVTYDVLMMLFAEYLNTLQSKLSNIICEEIGKNLNYSIAIIPFNYAQKNSYYLIFKNKLLELSSINPIVFDTREYNHGVQTTLIFRHDDLPNIFARPDNFGERFCIKGLIESIYLYNSQLLKTANSLAQDFIDKFIPIAKKRYSIELLSHPNNKLESYNRPIKVNNTDIAIVNRKISEFLIQNSYSPREYKNDEAKKLINAVFNFLQAYLESNIIDFHESLLPFAYTQLELLLGKMENSKLRTGMQAKGNVDFDIIDNQKEVDYENASLSANIKHIIHTLLKVGINGRKHVMNENWTYLLAISSVLLEVSHIFDNIKYDLRGHLLEIDKHYILKNKGGDEIFDSFTYRQDRAASAVESAKQSHSKAHETEKRSEEIYPRNEEMIILDDAFVKEFSFKYEDLMFVIFSIRAIDWKDGIYFPLIYITIDELIGEIHKADKLSIQDNEIKLIVEFLSLNVGMYEPEFSLLPSNMMQFKGRINVSPFVKVKNKLLFGREHTHTSAMFWNSLILGYMPYKLSENSQVQNAIKIIHKKTDKELEKDAENKAKDILSDNFVEAHIDNFRRLSSTFKAQEDCGEIDVLCINPKIKTIFVLDAKNVNKRVSPYYIKRNIEEFILDKRSYYNKLLKKKLFVENNLEAILIHFKQDDFIGWRVKEAFVTNNKHFAAYYINTKIDFIEIEDMHLFLSE